MTRAVDEALLTAILSNNGNLRVELEIQLVAHR